MLPMTPFWRQKAEPVISEYSGRTGFRASMRFKDIVAECRPHQYLKNGFVIIGPLFSEHWSADLAIRAALAFTAFCAMSSAVYCFNDILDIAADRLHPTKCRRPVASGAIPINVARGLAAGLACTGLVLGALVSQWAVLFVLSYAIVNLCYSFMWKHVPVIDVFLISTGFMLRLLTGTLGLGVVTSDWLLLCGLMLTLFLGFAKRYAELRSLIISNKIEKLSTRKVLGNYTPEMIEQFMTISAACTIISYSLYTVSPETVSKHHTNYLIITVPFVIYGIFRYLFLLHKRNGGQDTAKDVLFDRHMLVTGIIWFIITLLVLINV